eukprot:scaffold7092_cov262-Pinguiococcus_pyrenoidosus.AAC.41
MGSQSTRRISFSAATKFSTIRWKPDAEWSTPAGVGIRRLGREALLQTNPLPAHFGPIPDTEVGDSACWM